MKRNIRFRFLLPVLLLLCAALLSGCHGSREQASFQIPDTFDTTHEYEITVWAKNDTTKAQTDIYEQAIRW